MAQPFDANHILDIKFIPVQVEYDYQVTVEVLRSRNENRNLESPQLFRTFSVSLTGDDPANHCEFDMLRAAFIRARGRFEGFYLKLPSIIEENLIPVRFDTPFRFNFVAPGDECKYVIWDIQDLRMIEIPDPTL